MVQGHARAAIVVWELPDVLSCKDFEASSKFLGARPGFVFKRGRRGPAPHSSLASCRHVNVSCPWSKRLGYYRDLGPFHDPSQDAGSNMCEAKH